MNAWSRPGTAAERFGAPLRRVWRQCGDRVGALPPRARLLGLAVTAALLGALADALVWEPAMQSHRALAVAEAARRGEADAMRAQLSTPPAAELTPRRRLTAEWVALKSELQALRALDAQLAGSAPKSAATPADTTPADADALPALLAQTLPGSNGPALVSMAGSTLPATAESPQAPAAPALSLRLRGRYAELQRHLAEMAQRDATVSWPAWELDARSEPPVLLLQRTHDAGRP